jgi:hypothetical protein
MVWTASNWKSALAQPLERLRSSPGRGIILTVARPLGRRNRAWCKRRDAFEELLTRTGQLKKYASTITGIGLALDQTLLDQVIQHTADGWLRDSQRDRKPSDSVVLIEQIACEKHRELPDGKRMAVLVREACQDSVEVHKAFIGRSIFDNHEMSPMCQDAGRSAYVQNPQSVIGMDRRNTVSGIVSWPLATSPASNRHPRFPRSGLCGER